MSVCLSVCLPVRLSICVCVCVNGERIDTYRLSQQGRRCTRTFHESFLVFILTVGRVLMAVAPSIPHPQEISALDVPPFSCCIRIISAVLLMLVCLLVLLYTSPGAAIPSAGMANVKSLGPSMLKVEHTEPR